MVYKLDEKILQKKIMLLIKAHAKTQGLTQAALARKLKTSIPTLKRWLAGSTISFEHMEKLCKTLNLSLGELIIQAEDATPRKQSYSAEQEEFFVTAPDALAFFDQLIQGKKVSAIKKKFHLTDQQIERYLSQLDKQGLIDWLPKNKVALKFSGEPVWQKNGPLASHFGKSILADFLHEQGNSRFLLAEILPDDQKLLISRLDDLTTFVSQCTRRAKAQPDLAQSYGMFVLGKPYRWQLDRYLMKKNVAK
jgi:transcriptional regulator with XRE-family HTH domain